MRTAWVCILMLMLLRPSPAESSSRSHKQHKRRAHTHLVHTVFLGPWHSVPYSPNPDASTPSQSRLRVRALVVDGRIADWTTGPVHLITPTSYTVRQAVRINNSLPSDPHQHWIWQLGSWLAIHRLTGHVAVLHLPGYDPRVSNVAWFRDLAAYCGLRGVVKPRLTLLVARIGTRVALVSNKITPWNPARNPALLSTPACAPVTWKLNPLRVRFQPSVGKPYIYRFVDNTPILMHPVPATPATSDVPIP